MITSNYLKTLDIASHRHDEFLTNYSNNNFSLEEFLNLDKILHDYKVSVFVKIIPKKFLYKLGIEFAKNSIYIYELHNKNDLTLRNISQEHQVYFDGLDKNHPTSIKLYSLANSQIKNAAYAAVMAVYAALICNPERASWYAIQAIFEEHYLPIKNGTIKEVTEERKKQIEIMKNFC